MTHETIDVDVELCLRGKLARCLAKHAEKRSEQPVALLANLIETILDEDMVDAVLDDQN